MLNEAAVNLNFYTNQLYHQRTVYGEAPGEGDMSSQLCGQGKRPLW